MFLLYQCTIYKFPSICDFTVRYYHGSLRAWLNGGRHRRGVQCMIEWGTPQAWNAAWSILLMFGLIYADDMVDITLVPCNWQKRRYHSNPSYDSSSQMMRTSREQMGESLASSYRWERHRELHLSSAGCRQQRQQRNWILMDQYELLWRDGSDCLIVTSDAWSVTGKLAVCLIWFEINQCSSYVLWEGPNSLGFEEPFSIVVYWIGFKVTNVTNEVNLIFTYNVSLII